MGSILLVRNAVIALSLVVLLATGALKAPPKSKSTIAKHLHEQQLKANRTLCPPLPELRIAFVTALIDTYEHSCKEPAGQTLPVDFIAYTDAVFHSTFGANNSRVAYNKWKRVDADRYRLGLDERDRSAADVNALTQNQHPFNRAKLFKLNLHRLPELKDYHLVVWLDATVKLINPDTAAYIVEYLCGYANVAGPPRRVVGPYARQRRYNHTVPRDVLFDPQSYRPAPVVSFEHDNLRRNGLADEVAASAQLPKYSSTQFYALAQPVQNVTRQYVLPPPALHCSCCSSDSSSSPLQVRALPRRGLQRQLLRARRELQSENDRRAPGAVPSGVLHGAGRLQHAAARNGGVSGPVVAAEPGVLHAGPGLVLVRRVEAQRAPVSAARQPHPRSGPAQ